MHIFRLESHSSSSVGILDDQSLIAQHEILSGVQDFSTFLANTIIKSIRKGACIMFKNKGHC